MTVDVSELQITDIDQAQRTSTRMIAYWASVLGSAEAEKERADAHYRRWRATCADRILHADPKAAEWKVKVAIESHEDFLKLKSALANAIDNAVTARGMFEACIRRANLAQSVGAKQRETVKAFGRPEVTRESSFEDDDGESDLVEGDQSFSPDESDAERKSRLKNVLKKKGSE